MKKIPFTIFLLLSVSVATAQFKRGSVFVGGSLTGSSSSSKIKTSSSTYGQLKVSDLTLTPQAGYFVIDNLAVGAGMQFDYNHWNDDYNGKHTVTTLSLAPLVRYYFYKGLYLQAMGYAGQKNYKDDYGPSYVSTHNAKSNGWELFAGYAILVNTHVAIEPQLSYRSMIDKVYGNKTTGTGLHLGVAFQIYLHR